MRTINADELKEAIFNETFDVKASTRAKILSVIDNAPTVTPDRAQVLAYGDGYQDGYKEGYDKGYHDAQKPQGEWIDEGLYAEGHSEHAFTCKNCGYQIIVKPNMIYEERYCKYCGADMRGAKE